MKPKIVLQVLRKRDKLSWESARYEFVQTQAALARTNTHKGKCKVLEDYMGLEPDYLPYFENKEI